MVSRAALGSVSLDVTTFDVSLVGVVGAESKHLLAEEGGADHVVPFDVVRPDDNAFADRLAQAGDQ